MRLEVYLIQTKAQEEANCQPSYVFMLVGLESLGTLAIYIPVKLDLYSIGTQGKSQVEQI